MNQEEVVDIIYRIMVDIDKQMRKAGKDEHDYKNGLVHAYAICKSYLNKVDPDKKYWA